MRRPDLRFAVGLALAAVVGFAAGLAAESEKGIEGIVVDKDAELARVNLSNLAYRFLVDVSSARIAIEKQDTATARQAINFAKADLDELKTTDVTADVLSGFAEKLNEASSNLTPSGIEKSRSALDSLYSNLLLFIGNLP